MAHYGNSKRIDNNAEAVAQELRDWGITSFSCANDILRSATASSETLEIFLEGERRSFDAHSEVSSNALEQLRSLGRVPVLDTAHAIFACGFPEAKAFLQRRLNFYTDLVERSSLNSDHEATITPRDIGTGLFRDVLYASMIGSPELAAYKSALHLAEERGLPTKLLGTLRSSDSHIWPGSHSLGVYETLLPLYARIERLERNKHPEGDPGVLEHRAVKRTSDILVRALEYDKTGRVHDLPEAIAWAQLGDRVAARLQGMKEKIKRLDLSRIGRFIGRSGDNRYGHDLAATRETLTLLRSGNDEERRSLLARRNRRDLCALEKGVAREVEQVERHYERSLRGLRALNLPSDELQEYTVELARRTSDTLDRLHIQLFNDRTAVQGRTLESLEKQLLAEEQHLMVKYRNAKSLADKAIDLHFQFNRQDGPVRNQIDWINQAPFGDIKRAHRMLSRTLSEGTVVALVHDDPGALVRSLVYSSSYAHSETISGVAALTISKALARYRPGRYSPEDTRLEARAELSTLLSRDVDRGWEAQSLAQHVESTAIRLLEDGQNLGAANALAILSLVDDGYRVPDQLRMQIARGLLTSNRFYDARETLFAFGGGQEELNALCRSTLSDLLGRGNLDEAVALAVQWRPSDVCADSEEVAVLGVHVLLTRGDIKQLATYIDAFGLSRAKLTERFDDAQVVDVIDSLLDRWKPDVQGASYVLNIFGVSISTLTPRVESKVEALLESEHYDAAGTIEEWAGIPLESRAHFTRARLEKVLRLDGANGSTRFTERLLRSREGASEFIGSEDMKEQVTSSVRQLIVDHRTPERARILAILAGLSGEVFDRIAFEVAQRILDEGRFDEALKILSHCDTPPSSPLSLTTSSARRALRNALQEASPEKLHAIYSTFDVPPCDDPALQKAERDAAFNGVVRSLSQGAPGVAHTIKIRVGLTDEDYRAAGVEAIAVLLDSNDETRLDIALSYRDEGLVSDAQIRKSFQRCVERGLNTRSPETTIRKLQYAEGRSVHLTESEPLREAVEGALVTLVTRGALEELAALRQRFRAWSDLRDVPGMATAGVQGLKVLCGRDDLDGAQELVATLSDDGHLPPSMVDALKQSIGPSVAQWVASGRVDHLHRVTGLFSFTATDVRGMSGVQNSIPNGIETLIASGNTDGIVRLKTVLALDDQQYEASMQRGTALATQKGLTNALIAIRDGEIVRDSIFVDGLQDGAMQLLLRDDLSRVRTITSALQLTGELQENLYASGTVALLKEGRIHTILDLNEKLPDIHQRLRTRPDVVSAATLSVVPLFAEGRSVDALHILTAFDISADEIVLNRRFKDAFPSSLRTLLKEHSSDKIVALGHRLALEDDALADAVGEAVYRKLKDSIFERSLPAFERVYRETTDALASLEPHIRGVTRRAEESFVRHIADLFHTQLHKVSVARDRLGISDDSIGGMPVHLASLQQLGVRTISELVQFATGEGKTVKRLTAAHPAFDASEIFEWVKNHPGTPLRMTPETLQTARKLWIRPLEAEQLLTAGVDLEEALRSKDFERVYRALIAHCPEWRDRANVQRPFEAGAQIFGHKTMLQYADRPALSRHDAYFAWQSIVRLFEFSTLSPDQFNQRILQQIRGDNSRDERGLTSHHRFNELVQSINLNLDSLQSEAHQFDAIPTLKSFIREYPTPANVCRSWSSLTRFRDFQTMLQSRSGLAKLDELRRTGGDEALCSYVETLLFHKTSKVDMSAAMEFLESPETFLARDDMHAPSVVHRAKKPSNYTQIPHLDLSAEELVGALVHGDLDAIQAFTPFSVRYEVPKSGTVRAAVVPTEHRVRDELRRALGAEGKGEARNAKKLFGEVERLLRTVGIEKQNGVSGTKQFLEGTGQGHLHAEQAEQFWKTMHELIHDPAFGIRSVEETITLHVTIHPKSSADAVLAGDDTACCMPFGSGKNGVYTFNPMCALLTVQLERSDGSLRTVAQSVLTQDKDLEISVPDLVSAMERGKKLTEVVPERTLREARTYLCADNVEVAPAFKNEEWARILTLVYKDFFADYLARYGEAHHLVPHVVPIGMGYSDALTDRLPKMPNTFVPVAPMTYSDKTGPEVCLLEVQPVAGIRKELLRVGATKLSCEAVHVRGVQPLDYKDSLSTAYVERLAYENDSLIVHLHQLENVLIATAICNESKSRPQLSLKYADPKGRFAGYVIAYEGRWIGGDEFGVLEQGEPVIYIFDMAAAPKSRLAGGKLVHGLLNLYERHYAQSGVFTPLYAEFKEDTSYGLVKRHLAELGEQRGITFEIHEDSSRSYTDGRDVMHPLLITARARGSFAC